MWKKLTRQFLMQADETPYIVTKKAIVTEGVGEEMFFLAKIHNRWIFQRNIALVELLNIELAIKAKNGNRGSDMHEADAFISKIAKMN